MSKSKSTGVSHRPSEVIERARKTYANGNPIGLLEALPYFFDWKVECPEWVSDGLESALRHFVTTFKGPTSPQGSTFKKHKADVLDYLSYRAVRNAAASGFKGTKRLDQAVKRLYLDWNVSRTANTVEKAYKKVSSALKTEVGQTRYAQYSSAMRPLLTAVMNQGMKIDKTGT